VNATITRSFARYIGLSAVAAGIIGGAALGLAGAANAGTYSAPSPSIVATPDVHAHPAPNAVPGHNWHHGMWHLDTLVPGYTR
jgi:hypothetical protein